MTTTTYPDNPAALAAQAPLRQRVLRFPLTRLVLALVFFMVPFLLLQAGASHFFTEKLFTRMGQLLGAVLGCLSYAYYVTRVEKRAVQELALKGALPEYALGFAVGGLLVCLSVACIAALGGLQALTLAPDSVIVLPLLMHITVGLVEEMITRGIFFRIVQESWGTWLALLASGLLFGALHLGNDNTTVLGITDTAVAGVLLAAAYVLTGRIWFCAALHAAWNFVQDGIFSLAVSGHKVKTGLFLTELRGPDWLTGGAFGLEGSAVDLVLAMLAAAVLVWLAWRGGRMVRPRWARAQA